MIMLIFLPGQHWLLHVICLIFEPGQFLPPQVGVGLLHLLVNVCVPPPHVLVHGPRIQELHPPLTTQ